MGEEDIQHLDKEEEWMEMGKEDTSISVRTEPIIIQWTMDTQTKGEEGRPVDHGQGKGKTFGKMSLCDYIFLLNRLFVIQ